VAEQSPQQYGHVFCLIDDRILKVRKMLYELLTHCIPASTIIKVSLIKILDLMQNLAFALLPKLDEVLKPEVIHWAAFYEHRLRLGNKYIFHLEAFVAKGIASCRHC
jgi:replication factor C subunit 3/5